jgi:hypothetical protein
MTDAALPVTEAAVEQFADAYLTSLGADIEKEGRRWTVSLPDSAKTELELDDVVLQVASDPDAVDNGALAIAPGSSFVERMLDEAAERTPVGSLALTAEQWEIQLPPWLTAGPTEIVDEKFTPYYDRRALCILFHVGIETVSEYQREELHAVAVDLNDHEGRPELAESYLELTTTDGELTLPEGPELDEATLTQSMAAARDDVRRVIQDSIQETRERATRAAEVEFDEYRQFARERRDELEAELDNITDRIEEVTETIDNASTQSDRVEALRKRKDLRSERDSLRSELDELTAKIESGLPKKRREIRDRHSLTVRIRPTTATAIAYERGELTLTLRGKKTTTDLPFAYAVGSGILDDPICEQCGQGLTESNPLTLAEGQPIGLSCCGQ